MFLHTQALWGESNCFKMATEENKVFLCVFKEERGRGFKKGAVQSQSDWRKQEMVTRACFSQYTEDGD